MSYRIDIRIELMPDGMWHAIDDQRYDVDCDQDGYFSTSTTGTGHSPYQAALELLEEYMDEDVLEVE